MAVQNDYVAVSYKLYVKDEDDEQEALFEQCDSTSPYQFITRLGCVLPAFEKQMEGLNKDDAFDFIIPCKEAYGEVEDELMFDVPRNIFEIDGRFDKENIFEGNIVPLQGNDGQRFNATVLEVKDTAVTLDLNHPLAGQDLHYVGKVVERREATPDELTGWINMLSGEGCGCCCGHDHDEHCGCGHDHHHDDHCGCGHDHDDHCGCGHHHHG